MNDLATFAERSTLIKALGPVVSDKKIFSHFPYISQCRTCDPRGGAIFDQRDII